MFLCCWLILKSSLAWKGNRLHRRLNFEDLDKESDRTERKLSQPSMNLKIELVKYKNSLNLKFAKYELSNDKL